MTEPPNRFHKTSGPDPELVAQMSEAELIKRLDEARADLSRPASLPAPVPPSPSKLPAVAPASDEDPLKQAEASLIQQQALEVAQSLSPAKALSTVDAAAMRLTGIAPRDTIEQLIATQMLGLHSAAMDCMRRAMIPGQPGEIRREELGLASKASRAFAQLTETLDRRRRGGAQKVTVEHVHVHAGGQAIVGSVEAGGAGGTQIGGK